MNIKPIKTKKDYESALKRIEELWDAKKNTPKGDELDVLATLVEAYEAKKFKILHVHGMPPKEWKLGEIHWQTLIPHNQDFEALIVFQPLKPQKKTKQAKNL